MKRVAFHTLGCKVNQYETESMRERFAENGFSVVADGEIADIYVINTCTVTAVSDRKSRQAIGRMKKLNPDAMIAVTGCYAQSAPEKIETIPGVDIICGTNEKENLVSYVAERLKKDMPQGMASRYISKREELKEYVCNPPIVSMESRSRAYIKIEDGCDRFCSYCIVPKARGSVRSRPVEEVLAEARGLVDKGFCELILTGVNTALYEDLPGLLKRMEDIKGGFRVRLSSLEPTVVGVEDISKITDARLLCHHLHLSLQSGSDRILMAMKRNYSSQNYIDVVAALKGFDPLYGISTDIIAGFPGEDDEDARASMEMIEKAGFCRTHVFNYSKRPGTVAAEFEEQVPPMIRKDRVKRLMDAGTKAAKNFALANVDTVNRVVFEEKSMGTTDNEIMAGYTDNYIRAYAKLDEQKIGEITDVKIKDIYKDGVFVEIE